MPPRKSTKLKSTDVIFTLPADVQAETVLLFGEFNDWAEPVVLACQDDGSWCATVSLQQGRTYRFRYLVDGQRWENAWDADGYSPNPFGSEDSLVVVG